MRKAKELKPCDWFENCDAERGAKIDGLSLLELFPDEKVCCCSWKFWTAAGDSLRLLPFPCIINHGMLCDDAADEREDDDAAKNGCCL